MAIYSKSLFLLIGLSFSGCGGEGGDAPPPVNTYDLSIINDLYGSITVTNQDDISSQTCDAGNTCTYTYDENTQLVLSALPQTKYRLKNWGGDCNGTSSCSLTMAANHAVTSEYEFLPAADRACIEATPAPAIPDISWQPVVSGFTNPVAIASAETITNRLFIGEQAGVIRTVTNGELDTAIFLDISDRVLNSGGSTLENLSGLMSIALHPQFTSNGLFYVYYISERSTFNNINGQCTSSDACIIISEFNISQISSGIPGNQAERILMDIPMSTATRAAGHIAFGLESQPYLYISLGDTGYIFNIGPGNLRGSVLRINVNAQDTGLEYAIPSDNPVLLANRDNNKFDIDNALAEIWSYGFRLPWQFSFDPLTGILYLGDSGESVQEVNIIDSSLSYGWSDCEGFGSIGSLNCGPFTGTGGNSAGIYHTLPLVEIINGSMVSGNVYRGSEYTDMCGVYVYGDYISGKISALRYSNTNGISEQKDLTPLSGIIAFGTDQDLAIYALSSSAGTLYKLSVP